MNSNMSLDEISNFCSEILLGCESDFNKYQNSRLDSGWDNLYKNLIEKK